MADLIYNRKSIPTRVRHTNLQAGHLYRDAEQTVLEPRIYLATDEGQVVALHSGVQFDTNLHEYWVEVEVSITVGDDA